MAKLCVESIMTDPICPIESLATPSGVAVTPIGTAGATTYGYRVSAVNFAGETLASSTTTTTTGNAALSSTNFNRITWLPVPFAASYKVYGRTSGSELLIATVTDFYFDDFGLITPSGALPVANSTGYNSSKISIGTMFTSLSDGSISVLPIAVSRPREAAGAVPINIGCAVSYDSYTDWVFGADNATAATTRRIVLYKYLKQSGVLDYVGFVNLNFPTNATTYTIRGMQASYNFYNRGFVNASGWAVTATGATWITDGISAGSRIGFGTLNPTNITRWYGISSVLSETTIGIDTVLDSTLAANSVYCIEDLKLIISATNTNTAFSGLHLVKGLRIEDFSSTGTAITSAVASDRRKANYLLTGTGSTNPNGVDIEPFNSWTNQSAYFVNGTASPISIQKFNIRAALVNFRAPGIATDGFVLTTGTQAITGTPSQFGNGRIVTAGHGPGAGVTSLYFTTTSNVYRAATPGIINASTTFLNDTMTENPPGTSNTYGLTTSLNTIDYIPGNDRFLIYTTAATGTRHYITQYGVNTEFSGIFGLESTQTDSSLGYPEICPPVPNIGTSYPHFSYSQGNMTYVFRDNTTASIGQLYTMNFASDFGTSQITGNSQFIISPALSCTNNALFDSVYVNIQRSYNRQNIYNQMPPAPYKIFYRTSGFADNSGPWTSVPTGGALTSIGVSTLIQFKVSLRTIGNVLYPNRIYAVGVNYENTPDLPSYLNWNFSDSTSSTGVIGFIQNYYYGGVPNLRIEYFDAATNTSIFSQDSTSSTNGIFQFWSGSDWVVGLGSDLINQRRRFAPSLALGFSSYYVRLKTI
jgi:hypothetical protein